MRSAVTLTAAACLLILPIFSCTSPLHPDFSTEEEQKEIVDTVLERVINEFPFFEDSYAAGQLSVNPDPGNDTWPTKAEFEDKLDELIGTLFLSKEEFKKGLSKAINYLGDGHTSLRVFYYGAYPGIQVRKYEDDSGDKVYYIERLSDLRKQENELAVGDIILAVTPLPIPEDESLEDWLNKEAFQADTLADTVKQYIPASNTNSQKQFAANSLIAQSVFEYRDMTGQDEYEKLAFKIEINGNEETVSVRKGTQSEDFSRSDQEPFGERVDHNGKDYYYLRIPTMGYVDDIDKLDRLINTGMDCDGMILDLRRNSGGSSVVGDYLISRFGLKRDFNFSIVDGKTGKKIQNIGPVEARGKQYTGPVALLIDHYVFSSANHFAALCHYANEKEIRNFIFVGDTTGGGSAIPKIIKLTPELELRLSRNLIVNPEGKHYERGIDPDYRIDIPAGENEVDLVDDGKRLFPCREDTFLESRRDDLVLEKALDVLSNEL